MPNIADTTVDQDGRFAIVVPDVTQDPVLNYPANRYELAAQGSDWVLLPEAIAIDHPSQTTLNLVVTAGGTPVDIIVPTALSGSSEWKP